jgi:8-oxo-dGTP pyrophosphatase MutT (NUDIX family)
VILPGFRPDQTDERHVAGKIIQAAGGITVRGGKRRLFAVVQQSKDDKWVLPRGKLKPDENPVAGARREVIEETGHRVEVNEFLGAITYRAGGRPKIVQFWQMQAEEVASHDLMADIVAVEWLPLKAAVRRLSYPLEKLFLANVGRRAAQPRRGRKTPRKLAVKLVPTKSAKKSGKKTKADKKLNKKAEKASRKAKSKNKSKAKAKSKTKRQKKKL